jgi:oligopeptide/dipeptide ABC transporter ATP-binding protein
MGSTIRIQQDDQKLRTISGTVPSLAAMPEGCRFAPRCPYATDECRAVCPPLEELGNGRRIRCLHWKEIRGERHE